MVSPLEGQGLSGLDGNNSGNAILAIDAYNMSEIALVSFWWTGDLPHATCGLSMPLIGLVAWLGMLLIRTATPSP